MKVRALDANGDWTFGSGLSNYLSNNMAIAQNVSTRLYMILGTCFFDLASGINWFYLLGTTGQQAELMLSISIANTILGTDGVTGILNLSTSNINRNFSVTYAAQTVYSTVSSTFVFDTSVGG